MSKAMQLKAQIRNIALKNHVPAQAVLQNFMLERLLERISVSKYKDMIVLKGGMLIASMVGIESRTTMDMDATLRNYPLSEGAIQNVVDEICAILLDDKVTLAMDRITPIRDSDEYGGYRVSITATYETINTPLQMDITTGDVMTPGAIRYTLHSNFENKQIKIWAYNSETILAEKVETILRRSVLNTRPRDLYDVYILMKTQQSSINRKVFSAALKATAEKRGSLLVLQDKEAIVQTIRADTVMKQRWERYCKENHYARGIEFEDVIEVLTDLDV